MHETLGTCSDNCQVDGHNTSKNHFDDGMATTHWKIVQSIVREVQFW